MHGEPDNQLGHPSQRSRDIATKIKVKGCQLASFKSANNDISNKQNHYIFFYVDIQGLDL